MKFYLGTHRPSWLRRLDLPLFVSHHTLRDRKSAFPPATVPSWGLDSGGFTEIKDFGEWVTTLPEYVRATRRYADELGRLSFAAPMDWMCEPPILKKTGKTVAEHQALTVGNYLDLRAADSTLPFIPVLQGWNRGDYLRCVEMYADAGIDLTTLPLVGIGSVCRRQATKEIDVLVQELARGDIRLHGFGVKMDGLARYGAWLESSDSLAWSLGARKHPPLDGHTHKNCANCMTWALQWRRDVLCSIRTPQQARMV